MYHLKATLVLRYRVCLVQGEKMQRNKGNIDNDDDDDDDDDNDNNNK